ncbi:disease resistance RPP13-like protein 4 [Senna tora]|uniref:Disease resistance RPP13-like protein 4 n=1 Tax=Senna tora TaxID=362788 RepID=A0A835CJB3_9FABA|nr:disease resistance RPP13-like protein 4 [Senna tora]
MSIRTNPAKAVPALLNRLTKTIQTIKTDQQEDTSLSEKINNLKSDLNHMRCQFPAFKDWQEELVHQFTELDSLYRKFDGHNINFLLREIDPHLNQIKILLSKLELKVEPVSNNNPTDPIPGRHTSQQHSGFREISELEEKILSEAPMNPIVKNLRVSYDCLHRLDLRICLLFLTIFPENAVLKKMFLIYWWIGEGLVTTEEEGEEIFQELLKLEFIIPYGNGKSPIVNKCRIHPWVRYMLITVAIKEKLLHFDQGVPRFDTINARRACLIGNCRSFSSESHALQNENLRTIFNVSESYLSLKPEWLAKLGKLEVLQLGRWQNSPTHHIEVEGKVFLTGLRGQKHLKYLSLRGISRITAIPSSIVQLVSLEILDLKACHNLETLPSDISSLRKLTHLDVSECYLLESMPKGLDKLTSLKVLKGFIIGNSDSEKSPGRISNLRDLNKLERLSIHIGSEALIQVGEFDKLKDLKSVRCLKISWGVVQKRKDQVVKEYISFPPLLEKLDLEGIPQEKMPEWLKPSKLKQLKKLYMKGGELRSLDHGETDKWNNVEILCLKYMKNLEIELSTVKGMFPSLNYVQKMGRKKVEDQGADASEMERLIGIDLAEIFASSNCSSSITVNVTGAVVDENTGSK